MEKMGHNEVKKKIAETERNLEKITSKCRKYNSYLLGILLIFCGCLVFLPYLILYLLFIVYAIVCLTFMIGVFPKRVEKANRGLNELKELDKSYEMSKIKKPIREAITKSIKLYVNEVEIPCPKCNSKKSKYKDHSFLDHDLVELSLVCDCGKEFKTTVMNSFL